MTNIKIPMSMAVAQAVINQLPSALRNDMAAVHFLPDINNHDGGFLCIDSAYAELARQIAVTSDLVQKYLMGLAASIRYDRQGQGITVGGTAIRTDTDSINLINGAVNLVNNDPSIIALDFKAASGWTTLTRQQIVAIGIAVGNYIQKCFSAEKAIASNIMSKKYTKVDDIISASEWPSTTY